MILNHAETQGSPTTLQLLHVAGHSAILLGAERGMRAQQSHFRGASPAKTPLGRFLFLPGIICKMKLSFYCWDREELQLLLTSPSWKY